MKIETLMQYLNGEFFTGVPDSQLKALCDYLTVTYGTDARRHVVAANEGNAAALAAGYHLATGKVPVVYLQNSGLGNILNPAASLLNDKVYGIPVLFIVGWRGEPGVHDEPQHIFQGEITLKLLEDLDIASFVLTKETTEAELSAAMESFRALFRAGRQAAVVVKKGALTFEGKAEYKSIAELTREDAIRYIVQAAGEYCIVSTTGKASRELFEIREANGQGHGRDFLTVGSMGHASSIAMGIALQKPDKRVWILDGDGAALMHLGAMAVLGANRPKNIVHIVLNNGAHETVGGIPTAARQVHLPGIAEACGYPMILRAGTAEELSKTLEQAARSDRLTFVEVLCSLGARKDLGRPTTTARENKNAFMRMLNET